MRKRTETTIETERILVISRGKHPERARCEICDKRVALLTIEEAARLAPVSSRTVYRWVEDGKLHFTETSDVRLLICRESIPQIRESSGEILEPAIRRERN